MRKQTLLYGAHRIGDNMRFTTKISSIALWAAAALLAGCGGGDDNSVAAAAPSAPFVAPSAATCSALASAIGNAALFPANVAVTSAVFAAATAASGNTPSLPEHCNVGGTIRAPRPGEPSSPGVHQTH